MTTREEEGQKNIYLNTAATGLLSPASVSATAKFQEAALTDPSAAFMQWMAEGLPSLRQKVAELIHTSASRIAFTPNFSYGLLAVMQSLRPLKKVLLFEDDYPSVNLPFELGGFEVYRVNSPDGFSLPVSRIREVAEKEKIQVIALSHVQFLTGFTLDLAELGNYCREKDIVLLVDATQSMGAVDINFDLLQADVLISSSYKWLNGGHGSAVLCAKDSFIQRFPPRFAGFGSMNHTAEGWSYEPGVSSYEPGHLNVLGLLQLERAVEQRLLDGVPAVEKHNKALLRQLAHGLEGTPFKIRGGAGAGNLSTMLCFEAGKTVHDRLTKQSFSTTWRKGLIRVSPHFYNTEEEIKALVGALKKM